MKVCKKCGEEKDLSEFSEHKGFKDGKNSRCKQCKNLKAKVNYADGKVKKRPYTYAKQLSRYKLTLDDYNKLLLEQDSKCAICKEEKVLVVDHCHNTGIVRGLLCTGCNTSLGKFKDSVSVLETAIEYLKRID